MTKKNVLLSLVAIAVFAALVGMPIWTAISAASTRSLLRQEVELSVKVFKSQEDLLKAFSEVNTRLDAVSEKIGANGNQVSDIKKDAKEIKEKVVSPDIPRVSFPDPPSPSELITWTDVEAKDLMRKLYPSTSVYRDAAFETIKVYPFSWYASVLRNIPTGVLDDITPGTMIAWFNGNYQDIATGYVWAKGVIYRMVPAYKDGVIGFYYLVDGKWIEAGSDSDELTPLVKAVNLIK